MPGRLSSLAVTSITRVDDGCTVVYPVILTC